jgi:tetratricopeptide (TPR) repeat protein
MEVKPPRIALFLAAGLVLTTLLAACAGVAKDERAGDGGGPRAGLREPTSDTQEAPSAGARDWSKYRSLALQYEKTEEFQKALFMWQVVDELSSGSRDAREKIGELEAYSHGRSEEHFSKAMNSVKSSANGAARKELLLTLAFDPSHKEALRYLRQKALDGEWARYGVREGDTAATVAKRIYGDPGMAVVVAYFNDGTGQGTLRQGAFLQLPVPEQEAARGKAGAVVKVKPRILQSGYDRAAAEQHYAAGVGRFLDQELPEAIKEWEETLRLYPDHPNARRDIQKTRNLLKKEALK